MPARTPRIIGFLQVRNEISSGHLDRFIRLNCQLFDKLVVYDDASDDGTSDRIEPYCDVLIRGQMSLFGDELRSREILLKAASRIVDTNDFYLWLDADEVLYASKEELVAICEKLSVDGFDGARIPHINLWRSDFYFRTDDHYDDLYPVRLWRCGADLSFPFKGGLHNEMHPLGMKSIARLSAPSVIHYGFASDNLLEDKFALYRAHGQRGRNLYRLVSEKGRTLQHLSDRRAQIGLRFDAAKDTSSTEPAIRSQLSWLLGASKASIRNKRRDKPIVTLVSLIYCSVEWLEFQYAELLKLSKHFAEGAVEILFVANNPTPEVREFLKQNMIPHIVTDTQRSSDEWFINYVYRGYNEGVMAARGEYVFLTNSDMAYAPGCLQSLLREAAPDRLLTSRLVEMGRMKTGKYGIERDFGNKPNRFRRRQFEAYAAKIRLAEQRDGGLFMPLLVSRKTFLELGGYPEGNLCPDSLDGYLNGEIVNTYAQEGEKCIPGDTAFFQKAELNGVAHRTLFESICYHFQAGERISESKKSSQRPSGVAIVNDRIDGVNNELVLWRQLADRLSSKGVRTVVIGAPNSEVRLAFWIFAMRRLLGSSIKPRIVFSNATFTYPFIGPWRKVVMLQDQPDGTRIPDLWLRYWQRVNAKTSDHLVSNDPSFVADFEKGIAEWIPVPLSPVWEDSPTFESQVLKKPIGLFVGTFAPVKGWDEVRQFILSNRDISWNLVSKYADDPHGLPELGDPTWTVHRQIPQVEIRRLMRESTFLLVNSPYETQCLVALEAASQNLPIATTPTGTLGSLDDTTARKFGEIDPQPISRINVLLQRIVEDPNLRPREALVELGVLGDFAWKTWEDMFDEQLRLSFRDMAEPGTFLRFIDRTRGALTLKIRQIFREKLAPVLHPFVKRFRTS